MAKSYEFTPVDVPPLRPGKGIYSEIIADFIAQGAESMQVSVEGMKSAALRAGPRRALKSNEDVKLTQRGRRRVWASRAQSSSRGTSFVVRDPRVQGARTATMLEGHSRVRDEVGGGHDDTIVESIQAPSSRPTGDCALNDDSDAFTLLWAQCSRERCTD
jgi:hypothetical protein